MFVVKFTTQIQLETLLLFKIELTWLNSQNCPLFTLTIIQDWRRTIFAMLGQSLFFYTTLALRRRIKRSVKTRVVLLFANKRFGVYQRQNWVDIVLSYLRSSSNWTQYVLRWYVNPVSQPNSASRRRAGKLLESWRLFWNASRQFWSWAQRAIMEMENIYKLQILFCLHHHSI